MIINRNVFFELQTKYFQYIPFNQTNEWQLSTNNSPEVHYFVNDITKPVIACWGRVFERNLFGKHLMIDGLALQTDNIKLIRDFFLEITQLGYFIIEISDINKYSTNFEIGIRQAGFIRPILSLSPLSIIVNTQEDFGFKRNWKRASKRAVQAQCQFHVVDMPRDSHLKEFLILYNKLKKRKDFVATLHIDSLKLLLKNKNYKLFFVKNSKGENICGRVVYLCNDKSYDVYAANSMEGVKSGAAYFIQESILKYLKNNKIVEFDYGRISPSNDEMNNIYVSKNYSGGTPISYNGQWCYSGNRKLSILYEFYKFLIKEQRRY